MTVFETVNGGIPYTTGNQLTATDVNKFVDNDRSNALAARTSWQVGPACTCGSDPTYLWSSPSLHELVKCTETDVASLRYEGGYLDYVVAAGTSVISSGSWMPVGGSSGQTHELRVIGTQDWTNGYDSDDGGATFTVGNTTSTAGNACGPAALVGGLDTFRHWVIPGVTADSKPAWLLGWEASGTAYTATYAHSAATGALVRAAGNGTMSLVLVTGYASMSRYVSGTNTFSALPTYSDAASGSAAGIAWDSTRSLFVMTRWADDDMIAVFTSPDGLTWSAGTKTDVGAGSTIPTSSVLLADIVCVDGAWFILRAKRCGWPNGETYSLICSLDAGASWTDMGLPPIDAWPAVGDDPTFAMIEHRGHLVITTQGVTLISSLISIPAATNSEAV